MVQNKVTLADFEIRYKNIREHNPKVKKCTVKGCPNPRDSTPKLGEDVCCAYHRMLFEYWFCDVTDNHEVLIQKRFQALRRRRFGNWLSGIGKVEADKIVLRMAQEGINWEC